VQNSEPLRKLDESLHRVLHSCTLQGYLPAVAFLSRSFQRLLPNLFERLQLLRFLIESRLALSDDFSDNSHKAFKETLPSAEALSQFDADSKICFPRLTWVALCLRVHRRTKSDIVFQIVCQRTP